MPISGSNTRNGMPAVADPLILELQGLCAGYGEIQVLWGIDMAVRRGEITALIGSNGAGKTTLMRALRLDRHDPIGLNRTMISSVCLSMLSSENRLPLFRIML